MRIIKLIQDRKDKLFLFKYLLLGVLIRLTLMPFTLHGDMANMNRVTYYFTSQRYLPPSQMCYPPLAYYTMSFFQFLYKPFMPLFSFGHEIWMNSNHVFRYSFLLKSYYLIFDLGIAFLLLYLITNKKKQLLAFKLWLFNPLVIFTCYIQGQFDVLPVFFVILSLYFVVKDKLIFSFLSLGIGAALKNFPFFFLIPALIFLGNKGKQKLKFLLLGIAPYVIFSLPYLRAPGFKNASVTSVMNLRIIRFAVHLGGVDWAYIFVIGYTLILIFAYFHNQSQSNGQAIKKLWHTELIVLLWMYVSIYFHPHWILWAMPFLVLFATEDKKIRLLYWLQIICIVIYSFHWGRQLSWNPFLILDPVFFSRIRTPSQIISLFFPRDEFINIFRSIFSGISIWMIYKLLRMERAKF